MHKPKIEARNLNITLWRVNMGPSDADSGSVLSVWLPVCLSSSGLFQASLRPPADWDHDYSRSPVRASWEVSSTVKHRLLKLACSNFQQLKCCQVDRYPKASFKSLLTKHTSTCFPTPAVNGKCCWKQDKAPQTPLCWPREIPPCGEWVSCQDYK